LHAKDKEFRKLYSEVGLEMLSKPKEEKIHPLVIDVVEELGIAL